MIQIKKNESRYQDAEKFYTSKWATVFWKKWLSQTAPQIKESAKWSNLPCSRLYFTSSISARSSSAFCFIERGGWEGKIRVSPIQKRSVDEYLELYGVVKCFNDRPGGSRHYARITSRRERRRGRGKREGGRERRARFWKLRAISQSSKCRFNVTLTALPRVHIAALFREDIATGCSINLAVCIETVGHT